MPTIRHLAEPILEGGVRRTNYFNGRVLTAEDLRTDQEANRQQRMLLGRTVGEGILYGLEVTRSGGNRVEITPGEAINRAGQVLTLPGADPLLLEIVPDSTAAVRQPGNFYDCAQQVVSSVNTGSGIYLLTAVPAGGYEGSAPSTGAAGSGAIAGCGQKYAVDGIQFRLALYRTEAQQAQKEYPHLRNELAYEFFGLRSQNLFNLSSFFAGGNSYGAMDALYNGTITTAEVPLALLYWSANGLQWLDMWAVRRRVAPALSGTPWDSVVGPRLWAEREAMFMQFRAELDDYRAESDASAPPLYQRFRYMPPVGTVPVSSSEAGAREIEQYFQGLFHNTVWLNRPFLRSIFAQAALAEPFDHVIEYYPLILIMWEGDMPEAVFFRTGVAGITGNNWMKADAKQ